MLRLRHSQVVSLVLAGGLVLGGTGMALAQTTPGGNVVASLTNASVTPATSSANPFALYMRDHAPSDAGTAITVSGNGSAASASNPFALYMRDHAPSNAGGTVMTSHIATARDQAINDVAPDRFR